MLRNLTSVALFLFFTNHTFSQAPAIEWQNTIGGEGEDYLRAVNLTSDGGFILGGYSYSQISGDKTEESFNSDADFWILKTDNLGTIEWQNTIGGGVAETLKNVEQTADGGYLIAGSTTSGIGGDKTEVLVGSSDFWLVKTNSTGSIEWQNDIGGSSIDIMATAHQTTDGGYIVGGYSTSGISGDKTESNSSYDYWILKLNSSGTIVWQNTIKGNSFDYLTDVSQTSDGGFILGGYSNSGIASDKTIKNWDTISPITYDYWIIKINSIGNIEWQKDYGGGEDDKLYSIKQTSDGGYIVGGVSWSGISGNKTEPVSGGNDIWILKLNSTGVIEWQNTIGGNSGEFLTSISQTLEGNYIISVYSTSGASGDKSETSIGNDYWVLKLNSSGTVLWENTIIGNDYDDYCYAINQTPDGGLIVGGSSESGIAYDKTESNMGSPTSGDYWLMKLYPDCIPDPELCNSLDDNCNGLIDDGITETISISAGGPTTFCQGGSVSLTATYSGASVQWKKNGINIPGATTATYNVTTKGNYSCVTTSACDTVESTPIFVNVIKNPNASISAGGPTTFCAGGSVILSVTPVAGCSYQWYKGATPIAGATSLNYTATTSGNYKCRVTKTATGCFKNSNAIAVSVPCREENIIIENTFSLYPNPANNFITIETDFSTEKTIYITDALGQIVKTITTSENNITIDLQDFSSGIYFIKMENGINSVTQKFVIQL